MLQKASNLTLTLNRQLSTKKTCCSNSSALEGKLKHTV